MFARYVRILLLLLLSNRFLIRIAITTMDWGRRYMLHMTVVFEGTVFVLTLDVSVDVFHKGYSSNVFHLLKSWLA